MVFGLTLHEIQCGPLNILRESIFPPDAKPLESPSHRKQLKMLCGNVKIPLLLRIGCENVARLVIPYREDVVRSKKVCSFPVFPYPF